MWVGGLGARVLIGFENLPHPAVAAGVCCVWRIRWAGFSE